MKRSAFSRFFVLSLFDFPQKDREERKRERKEKGKKKKEKERNNHLCFASASPLLISTKDADSR
jgi:hypothetical protein